MFLTFAVSLLLMSSSISWADGNHPAPLNEGYALFSSGDYVKALDRLRPLTQSNDAKIAGAAAYWSGLCESRLQHFDTAVTDFDLARKSGETFEDLNYEKGQALYALSKYQPALKAFQESAGENFKRGASTYYVAYINQLLENRTDALKKYRELEGFSGDLDKVKQPALLQMAELQLEEARTLKDPILRKNRVRNAVLTSFESVVDFDSETPSGQAASTRIHEIKKEFDLDAIRRMENGVPIAERPWSAKIGQELKYDSNVTFQADRALIDVSNKDSAIFKTDAFGKYEYILNGAWVLTPEFDANVSYYGNQTNGSVYQNDEVGVSPALRSRYEHEWNEKPAAALFDVELGFLSRDYKQKKELDFYSRSLNFVAGERVKLLPWGSTTLSLNSRFYVNEDPGQTAIDPGITLAQSFRLKNNFNLTETVGYDYNRTHDPFNELMNYRLNSILFVPEVWQRIDLVTGLNLALVDTRNQSAQRGTEKMINPSVTGTRHFSSNYYVSATYSYTKNFSLDKVNYEYHTHVVGMGFGYEF